MNGMADESVDFWKKAYTGENQTELKGQNLVAGVRFELTLFSL